MTVFVFFIVFHLQPIPWVLAAICRYRSPIKSGLFPAVSGLDGKEAIRVLLFSQPRCHGFRAGPWAVVDDYVLPYLKWIQTGLPCYPYLTYMKNG